MDLEPLIKDVTAYAKAAQAVAKGLQEIGKLDGKRADNLQGLHKSLKKLKSEIGALGRGPELVKSVESWMTQYEPTQVSAPDIPASCGQRGGGGVEQNINRCAICGCNIHRNGDYAKPTPKGRSHATSHHYVPERFFGRSKNRPREQRERIFEKCPWDFERKRGEFCYECHEELLHNPIFLPHQIVGFAELVKKQGLNEENKPDDREKIAGRIQLLQKVVARGIEALSSCD
jgi:hypothetical protein